MEQTFTSIVPCPHNTIINGSCQHCGHSFSGPDIFEVGKLQEMSLPPLKGWQCPVCSTVWAPFIMYCQHCRPWSGIAPGTIKVTP